MELLQNVEILFRCSCVKIVINVLPCTIYHIQGIRFKKYFLIGLDFLDTNHFLKNGKDLVIFYLKSFFMVSNCFLPQIC